MQRTNASPLGSLANSDSNLRRGLVGPPQNESTTISPLRKSIPNTTSITAMKRC